MGPSEFPLYDEAKERGLSVFESNGMPKFNRRRMTQEEYVHMTKQEGDLFAVFKDEFGAIGIEQARIDDYRQIVLDEIIAHNPFGDEMAEDESNIEFLIGIVMISNAYGYQFSNFVHLLRHDGSQVYDSLALGLWVSVNQSFFRPPIDLMISEAEHDMDALQSQREALEDAA
ncbi:hypothetical protein [Sphingomonas sp. 3-13AW]|uniref:hypothetical protein n=1 Tax=Sphingomonas sp. 3-13AW TaxID=3050450 RepID=UPI003BB4BF1C